MGSLKSVPDTGPGEEKRRLGEDSPIKLLTILLAWNFQSFHSPFSPSFKLLSSHTTAFGPRPIIVSAISFVSSTSSSKNEHEQPVRQRGPRRIRHGGRQEGQGPRRLPRPRHGLGNRQVKARIGRTFLSPTNLIDTRIAILQRLKRRGQPLTVNLGGAQRRVIGA